MTSVKATKTILFLSRAPCALADLKLGCRSESSGSFYKHSCLDTPLGFRFIWRGLGLGQCISGELSRWLSCATRKENAALEPWRHSLNEFTPKGSRTICWDRCGCQTTHYVRSQLPNAPSPFLLPHQLFSNLSVDQKNQEGMFKQTTGALPEFLVSTSGMGRILHCYQVAWGCWLLGPGTNSGNHCPRVSGA